MSLLERIYYFHEELKRNRYPNAITLTDQFEISVATARRDISYLRDRLLAPLSFSQKKNGFFYTEEDFRLPFEKSPKILFLLGMINKIAEEAGLGTLAEVQALEKRLSELVLPEYGRLVDAIHCEWVEVESFAPSVFEAILEAIVKNRVLDVSYRSAKGEESNRKLEPIRLISYQGRWYLLAFCRLRQDLRLFHIARISHTTIARESFKRESNEYYNNYLNSSFGIFKGEVEYIAKILFRGTAAELVRQQHWHKDQIIEEQKDGVLLSLPVSDDREILMKVLQYGAQAEVIEPLRLRQKASEEALKISSLYS